MLARSNEELGGIPEESRLSVRKKLNTIKAEWEGEGPQFGQPLKFKWNKIKPARG